MANLQVIQATLSIWHLIVILLIILLFAGPGKIENIGTSLGKAVRGFKKGLDGDDDKDKTDKTKS